MVFRKGKGKKDIDPIVLKWYKRYLKNAALVIEKEIEKAFDTERHSNDRRGKWPMLKPSTQRQRAWQGYSPKNPILYRTGKLKKDIKIILTEDFVEVVTKNFYSNLLNDGLTGYKKGGLQKIKPRRHLEIPDKFFNLETRKKLTNFDFYITKINEDLMRYVYKLR
tara:strand:+ start:379 stop:873 length:495 start_codon:yes stop_codon:yes gene_type:complete